MGRQSRAQALDGRHARRPHRGALQQQGLQLGVELPSREQAVSVGGQHEVRGEHRGVRAHRMRRLLERTARAMALAMLAWLLWSALRPVTRARSTRVAIGDVSRRASAWMRDGELSSVHVEMDATPAPADLELLAAFRRAALTVTWSGSVAPLGV